MTRLWGYVSELREQDTRIKDEKVMIDELRGELVDAQNELKRKPSPARVLPEAMSFSAGIPPLKLLRSTGKKPLPKKYTNGRMRLESTRHGFDNWTTCTMSK